MPRIICSAAVPAAVRRASRPLASAGADLCDESQRVGGHSSRCWLAYGWRNKLVQPGAGLPQVRVRPLDALIYCVRNILSISSLKLQTLVLHINLRPGGEGCSGISQIQLPERDRTDLNQSRTIVQAFFPV